MTMVGATPAGVEIGRNGRSSVSIDRLGAGRQLATFAAIILAYVISAKVGFRAAIVAEQITTVWAPTGIAIATLLLLGPRLWPAIWIGAFLANAATAAPSWTAVFLASGNTLEALAASYALRARSRFDVGFERVSDVLAFVTIASIICPALSATVGVVTLCAGGVQPWAHFSALWFDWWLGDALGALVVAPVILTMARTDVRSQRHWWMVAILGGGTVIVTQAVFGQPSGLGVHPLEYVVFPPVIAAAVAGGPAVTSACVVAASAVSIWNTLRGAGPFAGPEVHYSLVLLQSFMAVLASTALLLAAAVAERKTSERRETEAAMVLRQRDRMLTLAQQAGGVATFEWDVRNQVARCSAEFFRMFGLPARDGIMESQEWAQFVHPMDRDRMAAHLANLIHGRESGFADYRIIRGDGTIRWLSYSGRLERTPEGDRVLGSVLDITDRKNTETALQEAKLAAESANQLKDQFLATLSHELRTPLNAILGYARMLRTESIPPAKRQRAIEIIERNAVAQNRLVDDLLDMSRISTGGVRLTTAPVAITEIVADAIEGVRPAADAKRIALDLHVDAAAGVIVADRTRLQQVFWNVLTNAVKFTGPDGRVRVAIRRSGAEVEVTVVDTGTGIPADFLPFVFEPFRQADATLGRGHGGLGLGLAISKQLVELHGGTIQAVSAGLGQGATFIIRLPASR